MWTLCCAATLQNNIMCFMIRLCIIITFNYVSVSVLLCYLILFKIYKTYNKKTSLLASRRELHVRNWNSCSRIETGQIQGVVDSSHKQTQQKLHVGGNYWQLNELTFEHARLRHHYLSLSPTCMSYMFMSRPHPYQPCLLVAHPHSDQLHIHVHVQ